MSSKRCGKILADNTPCPMLVNTGVRYCLEHKQEYNKARGTADFRGYGKLHRKLRQNVKALIKQGLPVFCRTCSIRLFENDFDLGHLPNRTGYLGPQCVKCNRGKKEKLLKGRGWSL